jgi:hypothetical protein
MQPAALPAPDDLRNIGRPHTTECSARPQAPFPAARSSGSRPVTSRTPRAPLRGRGSARSLGLPGHSPQDIGSCREPEDASHSRPIKRQNPAKPFLTRPRSVRDDQLPVEGQQPESGEQGGGHPGFVQCQRRGKETCRCRSPSRPGAAGVPDPLVDPVRRSGIDPVRHQASRQPDCGGQAKVPTCQPMCQVRRLKVNCRVRGQGPAVKRGRRAATPHEAGFGESRMDLRPALCARVHGDVVRCRRPSGWL